MPAAEPRPRGRHVRGPWRPDHFGGVIGTVLLSAVLPGSAQLASGRKVLGRVALTVWILLLLGGLGFVAYVVATGKDAGDIAGLTVVRPRVLTAVRIASIALGAAWLFLLLDAWRSTRPLAWPWSQRVVSGLTTAVVAVAGLSPAFLAAQYASASHGLVTHVFKSGTDENSFTAQQRRQRPDGRINILLLGGDGAADREGVRTDSMQVASVDQRTGK